MSVLHGWVTSAIGAARRHAFAAGMLVGILLLLGTRLVINETTFSDRLVSPLLLPDTVENADAIVVLGAGVVGDCVPNRNAVWRVIFATRLWREGRAPVVVFTGGSGEPCPVAIAMSRFAREIGIPESNMQLETLSHTTRENGERGASILHRLGVRRVLVVTDRLHMRRSAGVFEKLGFSVQRASVPVYLGYADNVSMLWGAARESVALSYYRMRGWVGPTTSTRTAFASATRASDNREVAGNAMKTDVSHLTGPLVVLGASYAGGWTPPGVAGLSVINRGVSGQQSFEMLERFDRDVVAARPRAVIIWGFINDIFRAAPQDVNSALARVRDSYARMIEQSRRHGIEPILATETTLRPKDGWSNTVRLWLAWLRGKEPYQDRINRHVLATNRWLADVAVKERLLMLDFQATLGEEGGRRRREFIADDGSHITVAGYAALSAYATPILERHLGAVGNGGSLTTSLVEAPAVKGGSE